MPGCKERLPVELDPIRMAETGRHLKGCIELKQMKRLAPLLESVDGVLETELEFGIDEQGVAFLRGELHAELVMQCQRCMGEMNYPVETGFCLALLRSATETETLSAEYEPLIVEKVPARLAEILEDEVLLALPRIAKHELNECPAAGSASGATEQDESDNRQNPFAILSDLKKEH